MPDYRLGDSNGEIRAIKAFMRVKFALYAGSLADTELFDQQLEAAVREMQFRYGITVNGILDYHTQITMGYAQKPVLLTVNGFMGDMWQQMPADTARQLLDVYDWQPVGYNSGAFPLGTGRDDGEREVRRLLNDVYPNRKIALAGYSLGAIITADIYDAIRHGDLRHRNADLIQCVAWGSPRRPAHRWTGMLRDPGGQGIAGPDNLKDPDSRWVDYVYDQNTGDIYTNAPISGAGDDMTLIYNLVLTKWDGSFASILAEAAELLSRPIDAVVSIVTACIHGIVFATAQQRPHMLYPIDDAVATLRRAAVSPPVIEGEIVTTPAPGAPQTPAKAVVGLIGSLLTFIIPFIVQISGALPPQWQAVIGGVVALLTAFGVYKVPNKAKAPVARA